MSPTATEGGEGAGVLAADLAVAALALAGRFAAGATLWCVAPGRPAHAHHVAVEFVHPVIVGKKALPAVAVTEPDPVAQLRRRVRRGDVILVIGDGAGPTTAEILRRAPAWGASSLWLGLAARPAIGAADHVVVLPGQSQAAVVRSYHLLWELTHMGLEHGDSLARPAPASVEARCITCADEGRIGEVRSVGGDGASALVDGQVEPVDLGLLGEVALHDLVLVHAGVAIERLEALPSA